MKLENYNLEINYQPINDTWGVLLKKGNINHFITDKFLFEALKDMGKYIESIREL